MERITTIWVGLASGERKRQCRLLCGSQYLPADNTPTSLFREPPIVINFGPEFVLFRKISTSRI
jgi:hypothetical protein